MELTLNDLIAELEERRDALGGDAPVRVAYQPGYPLRGVVTGVTFVYNGEEPRALWLAVGDAPHGESPYAPSAAFVYGY